MTVSLQLAHGLGQRSDLALPGWLFSWGAAIVLAVSFFALAALWTEPKLETARARALLSVPRFLRPLCGAIGLVLFFGLVWFGFAGSQDPETNILPTVVYVLFWTMIPVISALFGDVFRPFNPWLSVGLLGHSLRVRLGGGEQNAAPRFACPESLGRWPAVVLLFGFGWLELVSGDDGRKPAVLAGLALGYFALQVVGMSLFGAKRWQERGDGLGVYFELFSRISPLCVQDGRFCVRPPLAGLTDVPRFAGTVAFVATMIGITVYDGLERGALWDALAGDDPSILVATLGLAGSVGIAAGFYHLGVLGMGGGSIDKSPRELAQMFAPSLVPIALGYLIAHYFSFMIFVGQALPHVIANPMGNSGPAAIDYFVSGKVIWWVQVAALLVGHVAGLVVAHDKAIAVWGKARAAAQSQLWMLVVMVGFTSLGLWLLSQSS